MKIVQRLFTLSTFVIGITVASATPITGIVADAQTGEAIIGATIYDVTEKKGVISDLDGREYESNKRGTNEHLFTIRHDGDKNDAQGNRQTHCSWTFPFLNGENGRGFQENHTEVSDYEHFDDSYATAGEIGRDGNEVSSFFAKIHKHLKAKYNNVRGRHYRQPIPTGLSGENLNIAQNPGY